MDLAPTVDDVVQIATHAADPSSARLNLRPRIAIGVNRMNLSLCDFWDFIGHNWKFLAAFVGGWFSVYKYVDVRARESKRPFLEKQMDLYFKACQITAELASAEESSQKPGNTAERFWKLYWGELSLVENRDVEETMVLFG